MRSTSWKVLLALVVIAQIREAFAHFEEAAHVFHVFHVFRGQGHFVADRIINLLHQFLGLDAIRLAVHGIHQEAAGVRIAAVLGALLGQFDGGVAILGRRHVPPLVVSWARPAANPTRSYIR